MEKKYIHLQFDLDQDFKPSKSVAIDAEAMGLKYHRDRLCLLQIKSDIPNDPIRLVQFTSGDFSKSPKLKGLLQDDEIEKIFHFARFDIGLLQHTFNIKINNIFCTKIASKLVRTYTQQHSLKVLCKEFLNVELAKEEQSSDWGNIHLTDAQLKYAAQDVLYLHALQDKLIPLLYRESRMDLFKDCCNFLSSRCELDRMIDDKYDIFAHHD
ncbi:MAG: hypothetical protein C0432_05325 [Candidatus Puniceispirillum sp.]|nr:hypothetical protein [Candidatus Pelagibacter sp.]MBA4283696.1 hypothetical protein [Candidatus Puniceispirillum sp.]